MRSVWGSSSGTVLEQSIWAAVRISSSKPIDAKFRPPGLLCNSAASSSGASGSAPEEKGTAKAEGPVIPGGYGLGVELVGPRRPALEPVDQQAGEQDVVAAELPPRARAEQMDLIEAQQPLAERRDVDKGPQEDLAGLAAAEHGPGAVGGGEDDRFPPDGLGRVLGGQVAQVEAGDRHAIPLAPEHGGSGRKLLGKGPGVVHFQAGNDLNGPRLQGEDDRGRRPQHVDHHHRAAEEVLGGGEGRQGINVEGSSHLGQGLEDLLSPPRLAGEKRMKNEEREMKNEE